MDLKRAATHQPTTRRVRLFFVDAEQGLCGLSGPSGSVTRKRYLTRRSAWWEGVARKGAVRQYYPISTSPSVRTRRCSALGGSASTRQDRDWLVAGASQPPRLQPAASVGWPTPIGHRSRRCHRAAVGHMRRLSPRRPVGRSCAVPHRDVDVVHGAGREVGRRLGATDARVRRATCTVTQVVVSGWPSGTRRCERSMTSTWSVPSTGSAAFARLSFQVALTHLLGFARCEEGFGLGEGGSRRRIRRLLGGRGTGNPGSRHRSTLPQPPLRIPDGDRLGRLTGSAAVRFRCPSSTAGGTQRDPEREHPASLIATTAIADASLPKTRYQNA